MPWMTISLLVLVLDQLTKQYAEYSLVLHRAESLFTSLNMTLMYNEGAAFSFLSNAGGWQRWFFTALSTAVSIALIVWLRKLEDHQRLLKLGLALILGGAIGNLVDRVLFGHVIDFIQVYYYAESCLPGFSFYAFSSGGQCFWPAFNIADAAISAGAVLLIADMFINKDQESTS